MPSSKEEKDIVLRILCHKSTKKLWREFVAHGDHKNYEAALLELLTHYNPREYG